MRLLSSLVAPLFLTCLLPASIMAAPDARNSLQQVLESSCSDGSCAPGYRVRFRQISFEPNRQVVTLNVTLLANPDIDYPVLTDRFEAQLSQNSFAAICKVKQVSSLEAIAQAGMVEEEFKSILRSCLAALTERTEKALGRSQ